MAKTSFCAFVLGKEWLVYEPAHIPDDPHYRYIHKCIYSVRLAVWRECDIDSLSRHHLIIAANSRSIKSTRSSAAYCQSCSILGGAIWHLLIEGHFNYSSYVAVLCVDLRIQQYLYYVYIYSHIMRTIRSDCVYRRPFTRPIHSVFMAVLVAAPTYRTITCCYRPALIVGASRTTCTE